MDFEIQLDKETFGLACFYTKGINDERAPIFLQRDSITIVIGWAVIQISW